MKNDNIAFKRCIFLPSNALPKQFIIFSFAATDNYYADSIYYHHHPLPPTIVLTPYVLISQPVRGFPTKPKMKEKSINGISFVYFVLLGEEGLVWVHDEMIF